MTDIAVIILVGLEEIHMRRCIERLRPLCAKQVFVVESQTGDKTHEIAENMGATTVLNKWPGNQAAQFNWAIDNLPITAKWVLRLDADEYLSDGLIAEIKEFIASPIEGVSLVSMPLSRIWQNHRIRFGVPKIYIPRLFRFGLCRYDDREMDEKIVSREGATLRFQNVFIDDNLNDINWWKVKHRGYAEREARQVIRGQFGNKAAYYKLPPYLRAVAYWALRYFVFCGFLDGIAGWKWNWWQGLWYRWLVDKKICDLKREAHDKNG